MKIFDAISWLVVVNFALYFKTLRFKFVSDDFTVWKQPPVFKNAWHKAWLRFIGAAKLQSPSVHFVKAKLSVSPKERWYITIVKTEEFEHLFTLLLHTGICVSIFFAFGASQIAFIAALLYSVNPVNNQGTIWPGGRGYALPILSLMISMSIPLLAPVLLYFCSWYTIGFLAPLALIGSTKWYLLALMPFIWFLHARKFTTAIKLKSSNESFGHDRDMHPRKFILYVKTYGFYLILAIFPFRITFYHNFLQSMAGNEIMRKRAYALDRYFWAGFAGISGTIAYASLHWGPAAWGFLAFLITISQFCNVVRANQEIAERFVALPNVFLMFALACLIAPYPIIWACLGIFYATRTYYTVAMYKDEYYITELAVIEDPHAWWAWHCRAMKRWDTQSYKEALILWVMALMISPKEFKILMNLATCLRLLKNDAEADQYLEMARQNIILGQEEQSAFYIKEHMRGKLAILF